MQRTLGCKWVVAFVVPFLQKPEQICSRKNAIVSVTVWEGGTKEEAKFLASAYRSSLELAKEEHLNSISFPLISSGIYDYPKEEALQIAITAISEFLMRNEMYVYMVVFDRKSISLSEKLFAEIGHYIDTYYDDRIDPERYDRKQNVQSEFLQVFMEEEMPCYESVARSLSSSRSIEDVIKNLDETFSEMLMRLIDEKGNTDVEIYKKANMDRKLFSKIRSNKDYNPKKSTALALAVSLELSLDETKDLLSKAGYSLSASQKFCCREEKTLDRSWKKEVERDYVAREK